MAAVRGFRRRAPLERRLIAVAGLVVLAIAIAALYSFLADPRYEAKAQMLVTPVPANEPAFVGFSLIRAGPGAVETAARYVRTPEVAGPVATRLRLDGRDQALDSVETSASEGSGILTIVGKATDAARAAQIANAFADELRLQRTGRFQGELHTTIRRLRARLTAIPASRRDRPEAVAIQQRLGRLTGLIGAGDPTLRVVSDAVAPADPMWPRPYATMGVAGAAVLLAGLATVLVLTRRDRRHAVADKGRTTAERLRAEREVLARRADELAERERELERAQSRQQEAAALHERRLKEVEKRERELARSAAEAALRARELEQGAQQAEAHARELHDRADELERRETELAERPPPFGAAPAAPIASGEQGRFTLPELERLVESRGRDFPERREEWVAYVFSLREHADADGKLPRTFDYLVEEVFGEALAQEQT